MAATALFRPHRHRRLLHLHHTTPSLQFSSSSSNNSDDKPKPKPIPTIREDPNQKLTFHAIRKYLSKFRRRSNDLPPPPPSSAPQVSFQELYKRNNMMPKPDSVTGSENKREAISMDDIRMIFRRNKFSSSELDESPRKLREIEKKEIANTGGFNIEELRESLAKLQEDVNTKRNLGQRSNILGPLGGTPSFMLSPPKEVLVEKFVGLREIEKKENVVDELDETDHLVENNDIGLENLNDCDDVQVTCEVKAPTKKTSKSKKRKLEEDDVFFSKIISSLDNISSAIDRSTKVIENSRPHVYSEAEIYEVLKLMGLECHKIPRAYLFLVDHPDKTRALFGAPNEMRLTILATMMA